MTEFCTQLIHTDDLSVSPELLLRVSHEGVVTELAVDQHILRLYSVQERTLTQIMPLLHDFGFGVIDEVSLNLSQETAPLFLYRFRLDIDDQAKLRLAAQNIEEIVSGALIGTHFSQCRLLMLVYREHFTLREVMLMRAFIEYLNQAALTLNHDAILATIIAYPVIARNLLEYFIAKFDPATERREEQIKKSEKRLEELIKEVSSINDDRILKLSVSLIAAMVRTNYFLGHEAIAFKIDTKALSNHLKGLQPALESFIFHPEFSGLHLRMSRISRGGLRWSERHEDYRQEIKSLMITQEGKNAIIIPGGAKGGFVIRKPKEQITKPYFEQIYRTFIHQLLDLVDNLVEGKAAHDERIIAYDGADTYFVVAADKGTASMSDTANAVALERNYWLGDAFASGGSNGYAHKALGITAKGALRSCERFFIEKGINFAKEPISIVGIGSMNGDVFGNALLYSDAFKLIGAVSAHEIFIDPDPDPASSFQERKRLFEAPDGSWSGYDPRCISQGGGIFLRAQKAIELTPEIKKLLKTARKTMSGEELARALLCLNVDLLFNGGVGTYVKGSDENSLDLGDKHNEAVRIDALELRARCVCEGGNLGFTQKARIEYALLGGNINTDSIDNAAGVNTSDHEVNLKILLRLIQSKGLLSTQESRTLLQSLSDQVVNTVLWSNYAQSLCVSRDAIRSRLYPDYFVRTIETLERELELFKRKDFYIPKNENLREIMSAEGAIVRPVLSSLLSYTKIFLKKVLLRTALIDEPFAVDYLFKYFPKSLASVYDHEIKSHPLRREIIATMIANTLIDRQGSSFIADYHKLGEARFLVKIKSYLICNRLFDANNIRFELYRNDYLIDTATQYQLLSDIEHVLNFSTRWMVKHLDRTHIDAAHLLDYKAPLFELLHTITAKNPRTIIEGNERFNDFFTHLDYLRFAIITIIIKEESHHDYQNVGTLFFKTVDTFSILPILSALDTLRITHEDDRTLRRQLIQFIEQIVVAYTKKILAFQRTGEEASEAFANYIANDAEAFGEIQSALEHFLTQDHADIKSITVVVNRLLSAVI